MWMKKKGERENHSNGEGSWSRLEGGLQEGEFLEQSRWWRR